jgi:hypothetical protein
VIATTDSDLACITCEKILVLCRMYPELEVRLKSFQKAGQKLHHKGVQRGQVHEIVQSLAASGAAEISEVSLIPNGFAGRSAPKTHALHFLKGIGKRVQLGVQLGGTSGALEDSSSRAEAIAGSSARISAGGVPGTDSRARVAQDLLSQHDGNLAAAIQDVINAHASNRSSSSGSRSVLQGTQSAHQAPQ